MPYKSCQLVRLMLIKDQEEQEGQGQEFASECILIQPTEVNILEKFNFFFTKIKPNFLL